jgi:hypothetical protein
MTVYIPFALGISFFIFSTAKLAETLDLQAGIEIITFRKKVEGRLNNII